MGKKQVKKVVKVVKKTLLQVFLAWIKGLVNKSNKTQDDVLEYTDEDNK